MAVIPGMVSAVLAVENVKSLLVGSDAGNVLFLKILSAY
jgi:hypothetical protein